MDRSGHYVQEAILHLYIQEDFKDKLSFFTDFFMLTSIGRVQ